MDAFLKFSTPVLTPNQKEKNGCKSPGWWAVLYLWNSSTNPQQSREIFWQPYSRAIVHIMQDTTITTAVNNPYGNFPCKCFNCTLQNLLQMLSKDQKFNWPKCLSTLVFAYSATHIQLLGINPTNWCLIARHQNLVITGWGWPKTIIVTSFLKTPGFGSNTNWYRLLTCGCYNAS